MTLNISHPSFCVSGHLAHLCLSFVRLRAFMFTDSLVWAFPKGLDVYVPFGTLISSVSLNMPLLEIAAKKQQ